MLIFLLKKIFFLIIIYIFCFFYYNLWFIYKKLIFFYIFNNFSLIYILKITIRLIFISFLEMDNNIKNLIFFLNYKSFINYDNYCLFYYFNFIFLNILTFIYLYSLMIFFIFYRNFFFNYIFFEHFFLFFFKFELLFNTIIICYNFYYIFLINDYL